MTRDEQIEEYLKVPPMTASEIILRGMLYHVQMACLPVYEELEKMKKTMFRIGVEWADNNLNEERCLEYCLYK